jgi:CheY-like chemotaxis protein
MNFSQTGSLFWNVAMTQTWRTPRSMLSRFSKVLVVDDSGVARKVIKSYLNSFGCENVDEASNGFDALAMLGKRHYALVISDWNMALMDGIQLLQAMRASPRLKAVPFIMVTSMAQRKFAEVARDNGATHFLAKPFTAQALESRIASLRDSLAA